ncbi:MAG: SWIM zinc finger family protein [Bacteroidales bacterium]|nr:SWIM zinc finger family protein [Bacteroidales bacterium]
MKNKRFYPNQPLSTFCTCAAYNKVSKGIICKHLRTSNVKYRNLIERKKDIQAQRTTTRITRRIRVYLV